MHTPFAFEDAVHLVGEEEVGALDDVFELWCAVDKHRYRDTRYTGMQGCKDARVQGYKGKSMQGYTGTRV